MKWFRYISWIIKLSLLAVLLWWLFETPGQVQMDWRGWEVSTSFSIFALGLLVFCVFFSTLHRFWLFLWRVPGGFLKGIQENRRRKGFDYLTLGVLSIAAEDGDAALKYATRAEKYLGSTPLAQLLSAQAAQLNHDYDTARESFQKLANDKTTQLIGLHGLIEEAIREKDYEAALRLCRRAYKINHRAKWVLAKMHSLLCRFGQWQEALDVLPDAMRAGALDIAVGNRHKSVILVELSKEEELKDKIGDAIVHARMAADLCPDSPAAIAQYARLLITMGKYRRASWIIEKGWQKEPHPDLANLYELAAPDESPIEHVKRAEALTNLNPTHEESHMAVAQAALKARLWGQARKHLLQAAQKYPSMTVFQMLSELEINEKGDAAAARVWLERALHADAPAHWICDSCGTFSMGWGARCGECGTFASLYWSSSTGRVKKNAHVSGTHARKRWWFW